MKLEQQVVSLELAKKLKELGVGQESYFHWTFLLHNDIETFCVEKGCIIDDYERREAIEQFDIPRDAYIAAFSVAELGDIMKVQPYAYPFWSGVNEIWKWFENVEKHIVQLSDTEADARAKCLIYLIENGIVKP